MTRQKNKMEKERKEKRGIEISLAFVVVSDKPNRHKTF